MMELATTQEQTSLVSMQDDMDEVRDLLNLDSYDRFIKYSQRNNQLNIDELCNDFYNLRKMGMERDQAALLCGITPDRLQSLLYGIGISEDAHSKILAAEMRANAAFEKFHLAIITKHAKDDWRAAGWLLERIGPKRYKPITKVQQEVTVHNPHAAVNELARLRAMNAVNANQDKTYLQSTGTALAASQINLTVNMQGHATDAQGTSHSNVKIEESVTTKETRDLMLDASREVFIEAECNRLKKKKQKDEIYDLEQVSQARPFDKLSPGGSGDPSKHEAVALPTTASKKIPQEIVQAVKQTKKQQAKQAREEFINAVNEDLF